MHGWSSYLPPHAECGEESHLRSILILCGCVGERMTLQFVLRYRSCKLAKIPSFACKIPLWGNFKEKWQLWWIGRLGMLQICDCKGCCAWRRLWAWILWRNVCSEVWQTKRWRWCQIKPIDRCYLSVSTTLNV